MNKVFFCVISFCFLTMLFSMDYQELFYHDTPREVIQGDQVQIDLIQSAAVAGVYNLYLFYREYGAHEYNMIPMKGDGYRYYANINVKDFKNGQLEYYFGIEDPSGRTGSIPGETPQLNPYTLAIAPVYKQEIEDNSSLEVVIISPEPGDIASFDELIIAASIIGDDSQIDPSKLTLMFDGVNVMNLSDYSDGVVTYIPSQIRRGHHNIELNIYNREGELLTKKEWSFRARDTYQPLFGTLSRGTFFMENKYVDLLSQSENYFRTGGEIYGTYKNLEYKARLLISSEEDKNLQPVNIYNGQIQYYFTEYNHVYLNLGDFTPFYNSLVLQNKRMRGLQSGLAFGTFTLDFITAQLYRGIEQSTTSLLVNGTYEQNLIAFRPGFRFSDHISWNLNLVNAREDPESITTGTGGNAKESLVVGSDLSLNFDKKRIILDASIQASINNSDAGGEEITFEELTEINSSLADESLAEKAYNFLKSTGFVSMTGGLNPMPSLAMEFNACFIYFKNYFKVKYFNVDQNFVSPGNPFLLQGIKGFYLSDRIRLLENKMFLNLFMRNYQNNSDADELATNKNELGISISYFPSSTLPSVSFGFTNINSSNDVSGTDIPDTTYLYAVDNSSQRFNFSTSYNVHLKNIKNTISFNLLSYNNDDLIYKERNIGNTSYNIGVRSIFEFPLTSQISFYQLSKTLGDSAKIETDITGFTFGLEYLISDIIKTDQLIPFINLSFTQGDFSRSRYMAGITYKNLLYGIFSINYSYYDYENYTNTIINAGYQYNF